MPRGAQIDAAVDKRRRGINVCLEVSGGNLLPFTAIGEDSKLAAFADDVDLAVARDGGSVVVAVAGGNAVTLDQRAVAGVEAGKEAAVLDREHHSVDLQR